MIAYHIQAAKAGQEVNWLIDTLDDGVNRFAVTVDRKSRTHFQMRDEQQAARLGGRLWSSNQYPVIWATITQVHSLMSAISALLSHSDWEYFINLSSTCIPIKSQNDLKNFLIKKKGQGITSFCWHHKTVKPFFTKFEEGSDEVRIIQFRADTKIQIAQRLSHHFDGWTNSPFMRLQDRPAFHCSPIPEEAAIYVRSLFPSEAKALSNYFDRFPFAIGRCWMGLHRSVCEWLVSSACVQDSLFVLGSMLCPDETIYQSLLFSNQCPLRDTIESNSLHFDNGNPHNLTDQYLAPLQASNAFFARKIEHQRCPEILKWIESALTVKRNH